LDSIVEDLCAQKAITVKGSRDAQGRPEIKYILNPEIVKRYLDKQKKEKS